MTSLFLGIASYLDFCRYWRQKREKWKERQPRHLYEHNWAFSKKWFHLNRRFRSRWNRRPRYFSRQKWQRISGDGSYSASGDASNFFCQIGTISMETFVTICWWGVERRRTFTSKDLWNCARATALSGKGEEGTLLNPLPLVPRLIGSRLTLLAQTSLSLVTIFYVNTSLDARTKRREWFLQRKKTSGRAAGEGLAWENTTLEKKLDRFARKVNCTK